jgi:hypothetical protein
MDISQKKRTQQTQAGLSHSPTEKTNKLLTTLTTKKNVRFANKRIAKNQTVTTDDAIANADDTGSPLATILSFNNQSID